MTHSIESADCKADGEGDWVHCPTCDEAYQVPEPGRQEGPCHGGWEGPRHPRDSEAETRARQHGAKEQMSAQETLTENPPLVLDATCSFPHLGQRTRRWPAHASIRMDIRDKVGRWRIRPDVQADARFLPFRDGVFMEENCDPPHLMRKGVSQSLITKRWLQGRMRPDPWTLYGSWKNRMEWLDFVEKSGAELLRCLAKDGVLHYKITDNKDPRDTKAADVENMPGWVVIKRKIRPSQSNLGSSMVYFLTLKPKEPRV